MNVLDVSADEFIRRYTYRWPIHNGDTTMATKVKLKKGQSMPARTANHATKYAWDEWFCGDLVMIERSEGTDNEKTGTIDAPTVAKDYTVPNDSMPPKIKRAARHRYKVCELWRTDADGVKLKNAFILQARDMTADERAAEDIKRAEEKAAAEVEGDGTEVNGEAGTTE